MANHVPYCFGQNLTQKCDLGPSFLYAILTEMSQTRRVSRPDSVGPVRLADRDDLNVRRIATRAASGSLNIRQNRRNWTGKPGGSLVHARSLNAITAPKRPVLPRSRRW